VFKTLVVRGPSATIVWGYRTAAVVSAWTVRKDGSTTPAAWTLTGRVGSVSWFELKRTPLLFTAPRKGGFWTWPILEPPTISNGTVTAKLGPPV